MLLRKNLESSSGQKRVIHKTHSSLQPKLKSNVSTEFYKGFVCLALNTEFSSVYVVFHLCMFVRFMCVCMYVCMYVCTYVFMYAKCVCMYTCVCVYVYQYIHDSPEACSVTCVWCMSTRPQETCVSSTKFIVGVIHVVRNVIDGIVSVTRSNAVPA
jgi:hypothetical protein